MCQRLAALLLISIVCPQLVQAQVATVEIGLLGTGHLKLYGDSHRRLLVPGRRLLTSAPPSSFQVEACSQVAGLSDSKKKELAENMITKCINVFNVLVAGRLQSETYNCGVSWNMLYMANLVAELLDTKFEGRPTDPKVADHIQNYYSLKPAAFMLAGCSQEAEEYQGDVGYSYSSQAWKGSLEDNHAILVEETVHMVHQQAWAMVYKPFADRWDSNLGKCTKSAQCVWYQHPENTGCSDMNGVKCDNVDNLACEGDCAVFNAPGQCYATEDSCAGANCDLPEFFHKIYLGIYDNTHRYCYWGYMTEKTNGCTSAGIISAMESSAACTQLLADIRNPTYALARHNLNGSYTLTVVPVAPPSDWDPTVTYCADNDRQLNEDTGGAFSTCADMKQYCNDDGPLRQMGAPPDYPAMMCPVTCGTCPENPKGPAVTCGDIRKAFKKNKCCGNPQKSFTMSRRLSEDSILTKIGDFLDRAQTTGGSAKANALKNAILEEIDKFISKSDGPEL